MLVTFTLENNIDLTPYKVDLQKENFQRKLCKHSLQMKFEYVILFR